MKNADNGKYGSKKQWIAFIAIIAAIVAFDQITKYAARTALPHLPGMTMRFIPGFVNLTYVENTGAAFSMLRNATWLLTIMSLVMACVVIWLLFRYSGQMKSKLFNTAMCFIAGGAIGNLVDRIARGFVVDMLEFDFVDFAIFNVADCFITFGAVMLGIFVLWFWGKSEKAKKDGKNEPEDNA